MRLDAPGFLVVFEGIDGVGKTTQADWLQASLKSDGLSVIRTKEPTNGPYGQKLRDSMVKGRLTPGEELDLFIKDRRDHVSTTIIPALMAGKIVVIDRYYFSTAAYQGARGIDPETLLKENETFAPEPDVLFLLDVDPAVGLTRIQNRGDKANEFEKDATLKAARKIFLQIQRPYKIVIDANQSPQKIKDLVYRETTSRYKTKTSERK